MKYQVESLEGGQVTLAVPASNYRNTFAAAEGERRLTVGKAYRGVIHAPARKAELVSDGGNYVEPLFGRPRRMQGEIVAADPAKNELTVQVGYPVTVRLPPEQRVADFPVGGRVGWDNAEMPRFEPEG